MAGDEFDGKGTIWVHDSPVGAPARQAEPEPAPAPVAPPPAPEQAMPVGPTPIAARPQPAPSSGMGRTGCLVGVFVIGGVGLGLTVVLAIGIVGLFFVYQ